MLHHPDTYDKPCTSCGERFTRGPARCTRCQLAPKPPCDRLRPTDEAESIGAILERLMRHLRQVRRLGGRHG